MNKMKKLFQMKFSQKELRVGRKIIASIMLPIMIFQMTSMNFLAMELMQANAEENVVVVEDKKEEVKVEEKKEEVKEEKKVEERVEVKVEEKKVEEKAEEKAEIVETKTAPKVVEEKVETEVVAPKEEVKVAEDKKVEVETKTEKKTEEVKKEIGWVVDGAVASMEKVELNKVYKAPQNEKVTVTFTKLPEIAGSLIIKEIKLSNEEKKSLGALSDTAYDITSDMTNGTFEYDLTLPYPDKDNDGKAEILGDSKKEVKAENLTVLYTEGDELKQEKMVDVKNDKTEGVEKQTNKTGKVLEINGLDHFTIFVVTAPPVMTDPVCAAYPAAFSCVTSLQTAIDNSIIGGTIMVSGGTYNEATVTVDKNLTFEIADNVVINGNFIISSGKTLTFEGHGKTFEATGTFTNSGMISGMTSTSGNVVLKSGGNFTVGDISSVADISITSTSGSILDDGVQTTTIDAGGAITLSAVAGNIGALVSPVTAVSNFNNAIDVEAGTGNVQASALGNISVTETSVANVILSKYQLASSTVGSYVALGNLTAAGNLEINDPMDSDAKIALVALGNIIDNLAYTNSSDEVGLYAKGNVTVNDLLTVDGASGTAIIKAGFDGGAGSIIDDGDQTTTISAKNITLSANSGTVSSVTPGAGGVIDFFGAVDVSLGGGTLTTSGGYVTETGGARNGTYTMNGGNLSISKNFAGGNRNMLSANGKLKIQDDDTNAIILIGEYAGAVPSALNIATAFGTYYRVQSTGAVSNVNFELRYTVADRGALAESKVSNAYYNDGTWHGYAGQTVSNVDFVDTVAYDGKISFSSSTLGTIVAGADETAPTISETTRITTPANDNTPNYTFTTNEAGTISYGGDCSSSTTVATVGANTITFNTLSDGLHNNCTITVSDTALNDSNILSVFAFTVDTTGPEFNISDSVDPGPVKTDTINITVTDTTGTVASQFYGFSANNTCDISDTIATVFTSGSDFTIASNHIDYLCVKGVDNVGNITYRLVGQLNTDNADPMSPSNVHIATDEKINNSEKAAIHITGTVEANALVDVTLTDSAVTPTIKSGSQQLSGGATTFDITIDGTTLVAFIDGNITPTITATDAAGNVSVATELPVAVQDTETPSAPTSIHIATDEKINNSEKAAIHITGTVEANALVDVTLTDSAVTPTIKSGSQQLSGGATTFDITIDGTTLVAFIDGNITPTITATDAAGNVSVATELPVAVQDTINPTVTITNLRTNDTTPALSGTIDDTMATISVTVNSLVYVATNNTDGTWTLADNAITPALGAGTYDVAVTATDTFGNVGSDATSNELVIDLTAPTLTAVNIASNNANTAFAKIGDEVTITFTSSEALDGIPVATISGHATVVASTGGSNYTAKYTMQSGDTAGVLTFEIDFTDVAGNAGTQRTTVTDSSSVTFDEIAPDAPALNTPADIIKTNDTTPTVSWFDVNQDETSYIVEVDNDVAFGSIDFTQTVAGTINTSTVAPALSEGTYYWRIKVRDAASNESISAVRSFIIDTTAPTVQSITSTTSTGAYKIGATIDVVVTFSELVTLASGTLNVTLDTGDVIAISAFGPALNATGIYTVGAGDTSADLDSTGVVLNGVATLRDVAGNDATIELPATTIADGINVIVVDTIAPVVARSVLKATSASVGGYIKQGDAYIIYAQVDDATSGLSSVVGDFSNITTGENAEAMTVLAVPLTIDGVVYNYSSAQYTSEVGLAEGAKAYAINATDNATNSATQFNGSVVVDNAVPNDPNVAVYESVAKTLPALTTNKWYNYNTPYVEWTAPSDNLTPNASGINGYYICVDTTNACDPSAISSLQTATNFTFPTLTNGQTYYLRMEVKDKAGNITTTGGELFTYKYDNAIPTAGTVVDDGVWTNSTNTLHATWTEDFSDNIGITSYDYSIGTSAGDTSIKSWTDNLLVTSFTDAGLTLVSGTTYYVNVRAKDEAGNISSVVSSDGIRSDLIAPIGTIASSPTNSNSTFIVSWAGTVDDLSTPNGHYNVRYKDQSVGSWTDWLTDTESTSDTFGAGDVPVALVSGHTYYFEVAGQDVAGNWETLAGGAGEDSTIYDTTAPNNPTVTGYQTSGKTNTLPTNNWYNYANPYFEWTTPQDEPSSAGLASVGVEGYYVYFGTDNAADPTVWQTTANYTSAVAMTSGLTYYLRVKTKDNLGNTSSAVTVFAYKYDIDAPNNPSPVSGWSTSGKVTALTSGQWYNYANPYFDWSAAIDNPGTSSGVREYYKYFGTDSGYNPTGNLNANLYYSDTVTTSAIRYLRIKTVDNADLNATGSPVGNISAPVTAFDYRFDNNAPTTAVSAVTPIFDNGTIKYVKGDFTATGTATDTGGSGVGRVDVQIKDTTANEYWNGTAWQSSEIWVVATGTTSWSYATSSLLLTGRSANVITVQSKAYDSVNGGGTNGNSGTSIIYSMTVDIIAPVFGTNNTATTGTTGDTFTFSQNVTEAGSGINGVNGYTKVEYWYGTGGHTITTMSVATGTTFVLNVTLPSNSIDTLHYIFKTMDNVGNSEVVTGQNDVSISDNDKPVVNVTTENTTATANGTKTIETDVDDNVGVHEVVLHYRNYGSSSFKTTTMSHTSGNHYEATIDVQQSITGKMDYYVTADDANGNDDTDNNSGGYYKITVVAAALHHFDFIAPSGDQTAGGYFYVAVQAKDEFGNVVASFNGTGNRVTFTTDEAGVSAFVKGTEANLSGLFSGGSWMGEIKFGTGTVPVADNTLILRATKDGGIESGETTISAVGGGFGTVGSVEGAQSDGSQVQGDQSPADQGVLDDGVVKDGSPVASIPWYKSLPFEIIAVLVLLGSTIWWWIRRQGANGGVGGFSSFVFVALKAAASRARMFLW